MPKIQIPGDRNELAKLGAKLKNERATLKEKHGGDVPEAYRPGLGGTNKVVKVLDDVDQMRKEAGEKAASQDPELAIIRQSVRNTGNYLVRVGGPSLAKKWGFAFAVAKKSKGAANKR